MNKKGFTLIELMVVVIIVGILASLAVGNYSRVVEKGRAAEAKKIMSVIRQQEFAYYFERQAFDTCLSYLGLNALPTGACNGNNYFRYSLGVGSDHFCVTALRCTASGKPPDSTVSYQVNLTLNGTFLYNNSNYI